MENYPVHISCEVVEEDIFGSSDRYMVRNDNNTYSKKECNYFVCFIQIYTGKNDKTLKENRLVGYKIQFTLVHVSDTFCLYVIDNVITLLGFLPVGFQKIDSDEEEEENDFNWKLEHHGAVHVSYYIPLMSYSTGRDQKMTSLNIGITMALKTLLENANTGFSVSDHNSFRGHHFPII